MNANYTYSLPLDLLPRQDERTVDRSVFKNAYIVIPRRAMADIIASPLPFWDDSKAWVIARPMTGFSETFSHYIMKVEPDGGSKNPEPDPAAEGVLFVVNGQGVIRLDGDPTEISAGSYVYLAPGASWALENNGSGPLHFHWIRKSYDRIKGIDAPESFVANEQATEIDWMPGTRESWGTTRFVDPEDVRHDMHVNIVTFKPGAVIPFQETHVMEHGLYVLQGKAIYQLNEDWVEVESGDYMWLRAFCPQACYAAGDKLFRYLLYKDVNRHPRLRLY